MIGYFFHWYDGAVWSNILANFIWIPVALIGGKILHSRLSKRLNDHHEELMGHITKMHDDLKK